MFSKIILPNLVSLEIVDNSTFRGSVLDVMLANVQMRKVRLLQLVTTDLLSEDYSFLPEQLPSLRRLKLREVFLRHLVRTKVSSSSADSGGFVKLREKCEKTNIELQTQTSSGRCNEGIDLARWFARIKILSSNLSSVSVSMTEQVLEHLSEQKTLPLPNLQILALNVFDGYTSTGAEEMVASHAPSVDSFLRLLVMPRLVSLRLTFLAKAGRRHMGEVLEYIEGNFLPNLEVLKGTVVLPSGSSVKEIKLMTNHFCDMHGIDSAELSFIDGVVQETMDEPCTPVEAENDASCIA